MNCGHENPFLSRLSEHETGYYTPQFASVLYDGKPERVRPMVQ